VAGVWLVSQGQPEVVDLAKVKVGTATLQSATVVGDHLHVGLLRLHACAGNIE
jgi:hypothetical protein